MTVDKENTWRGLKDEDLIVTSFWCGWGIHKWTKWNELRRHSKVVTYLYLFGLQRIVLIEFDRKCIHCNISNRKTIKFKLTM